MRVSSDWLKEDLVHSLRDQGFRPVTQGMYDPPTMFVGFYLGGKVVLRVSSSTLEPKKLLKHLEYYPWIGTGLDEQALKDGDARFPEYQAVNVTAYGSEPQLGQLKEGIESVVSGMGREFRTNLIPFKD